MPFSINTVEVEICWPLNSATLHGWEIPQGAGIILAGWGVKVYGAASTPDATGRSEGGEENKTH